MPICIECRFPVKALYTEYSGAGVGSDAQARSQGVRLTVCKNCGRFCDKYVEHDFVVLFIDLVLIKPQVYRHLLHNALMREDDRFDASIVRLAVLLLLFDVYLTWARIEMQMQVQVQNQVVGLARGIDGVGRGAADVVGGRGRGDAGGGQAIEGGGAAGASGLGSLADQPIILQYVFFLLLCALSTVGFHASIRFLTSSSWSPLRLLGLLPTYARPNSVSTALLVSSSTKLFPILMVIWEYDVPAAARSLGWAVVANNVEALKILLDCGYLPAAILATAGAICRWAVARAVLWAVGLQDMDSLGDSGVAADGKALWALMETGREWGMNMTSGYLIR